MQFDPTDAIAEVRGSRATTGVSPATADYLCPYIGSRCPKRSTNLGIEPYPVCSLWRTTPKGEDRDPVRDLIAVCPKRFHQVDFLHDVLAHCWPFDPPTNPVIAPEVKMKGIGNVDFVIADEKPDGSIGSFLSVELQAIDITGSVYPAYEALRANDQLPKRPTYGFNWDNVYKRYITQLVRKGYFHHHWGTKIVAVIQDQIYQTMINKADFMRIENIADSQVNIIFLTYIFEDDPNIPGQFRPRVARVEGTNHAGLQQAILYTQAPAAGEFKERIANSIARSRSSQ